MPQGYTEDFYKGVKDYIFKHQPETRAVARAELTQPKEIANLTENA